MMSIADSFDDIDGALRRCGSTWSGAQAHGLLCGRLAVRGAGGTHSWLEQLMQNVAPENALRAECENQLDELLQATWQQLGERQSEFELLLPSDDESVQKRTSALAEWSEGFLHGLVADQHNDAVRERLAKEPLSDLIKDMLEITRAGPDDEGDNEENEAAYAELVEYLRVAAQLAYEELAELRQPAVPGGAAKETLH